MSGTLGTPFIGCSVTYSLDAFDDEMAPRTGRVETDGIVMLPVSTFKANDREYDSEKKERCSSMGR